MPFAASQPANSLPSGGVKVHSGSVKFSPDLTFMGCIVPVPPLGSKEMVISAASLSFHVALRTLSVVLNAMSPAGYTVPFAASQPANSLPSGGVKVHWGSVKFSPDLTFMGCIVPVPPLGSKEMVIYFAGTSVLSVNATLPISAFPVSYL